MIIAAKKSPRKKVHEIKIAAVPMAKALGTKLDES
jgi:hypothetical protein